MTVSSAPCIFLPYTLSLSLSHTQKQHISINLLWLNEKVHRKRNWISFGNANKNICVDYYTWCVRIFDRVRRHISSVTLLNEIVSRIHNTHANGIDDVFFICCDLNVKNDWFFQFPSLRHTEFSSEKICPTARKMKDVIALSSLFFLDLAYTHSWF